MKHLTIRNTAKSALVLFTVAFAAISSTAFALDRSEFADQAEHVTPLLDGSSIPNASVFMADGSPVSFKGLVMQKPSVVLFYRGGWCPYCNRQLAGLKEIEAELVEMGYQILAVSPESSQRLQEQKLETDFAATLISDNNLQAISGFGVGFVVDEETQKRYAGYGISLTENEDGKPVLPAPAVFIVDKSGTVKFSYVNPDFKYRPSASLILAAATALK